MNWTKAFYVFGALWFVFALIFILNGDYWLGIAYIGGTSIWIWLAKKESNFRKVSKR